MESIRGHKLWKCWSKSSYSSKTRSGNIAYSFEGARVGDNQFAYTSRKGQTEPTPDRKNWRLRIFWSNGIRSSSMLPAKYSPIHRNQANWIGGKESCALRVLTWEKREALLGCVLISRKRATWGQHEFKHHSRSAAFLDSFKQATKRASDENLDSLGRSVQVLAETQQPLSTQSSTRIPFLPTFCNFHAHCPLRIWGIMENEMSCHSTLRSQLANSSSIGLCTLGHD
jgi:hypothetical protein